MVESERTDRQIREVLANAGCDGWAWAQYLDTGVPGIGFRQNDVVAIASMYKLFVLGAYCMAVDDQQLDPIQRIVITPSKHPRGGVGFGHFEDAVTLSMRDLVRQMIMVSDNVSAHALIERIPARYFDLVIQKAGLNDSVIALPGSLTHNAELLDHDVSPAVETRRLLSEHPRASLDEIAFNSSSTARELVVLLAWMLGEGDLSSTMQNFAEEVLSQQAWTHRIPSAFPADGVRFSGKTGTIGPIRGEVSLISIVHETPIAVSVVTRSARVGTNLPKSDLAIGNIARILVNELLAYQ